MKARTADVTIGLDVGTTAVKGAAFGVGGALGMLAKALAGSYRRLHPPVGRTAA